MISPSAFRRRFPVVAILAVCCLASLRGAAGTSTAQSASSNGTDAIVWPRSVDEIVPPVTPGIACPLAEVLRGAAQRVKDLATDLEEFTATEHIEHRELERGGRWGTPRSRSFEYLVALREPRPGWLAIEESRDRSLALSSFPTNMATTGVVAFALIFHPSYTGDFRMSCEGLGNRQGQPAWQVRFEQRADRPARIFSFRVGDTPYPVRLKGRAWIAAYTFHVVRMETDMMEPISALRLKGEHLAIDYQPVQFKKESVVVWLPEKVEVFLDFRGRRFQHRHTFSDYMLFSVRVRHVVADPVPPSAPPP